jgi:hypothetical protein
MGLISHVFFHRSNSVSGGSRTGTFRISVCVYLRAETVRAEGGYTVATGRTQTKTAIANRIGAPGLFCIFIISKKLDLSPKSCSICRMANVLLRKTCHMCCEKAMPTASVIEVLNPVTIRSDMVVIWDCRSGRCSVLVPSNHLKKNRWPVAKSKPACVRFRYGIYMCGYYLCTWTTP